MFKDSYQQLSDGRTRFKRYIVQKVNNVKVPVEIWFYPDENVEEAIDEYEEDEGDYTRDLDESEVTIFNKESNINQIQTKTEESLDFPSQLKCYVRN